MPRGGDAVLILRDTTGRRNLRADLVLGQNAPVPRLGALAQLEFDHLHFGPARLRSEALGVEGPVLVTAAEVAAAQLPDQIAAVLQVIGADAPLPGVMGETAELGALVERENSVGAQGAETHRGDIQHRGRIGLSALAVANGDADRKSVV